MITLVTKVVVDAALLAAGFGVGRIKSVKTASAIKAELDKVGDSALAEVKALAADVRKHL
jgi:hypothetical protein